MIIGRKFWLKRLIAGFKHEIAYQSWDSVKRIGLLMPSISPEDTSGIAQLLDKWKAEGKEVQVLELTTERMNKKKEEHRRHGVLYANERNWKGLPDSPEFHAFSKGKFDVVLQLCSSNEGMWRYFPYVLESGMLVGPNEHPSIDFDLNVQIENRPMIEVLTDIESWLKKIKHVA